LWVVRLLKVDALATKVGAFTCLKSLLYARYVCATTTTLLIMLMLLDEFRVTKQEEATNLQKLAIFTTTTRRDRKMLMKMKGKELRLIA